MDRSEQEAWEDAELLPDMTDNARRWFLAERKRRKGDQDDHEDLDNQPGNRTAEAQAHQEASEGGV